MKQSGSAAKSRNKKTGAASSATQHRSGGSSSQNGKSSPSRSQGGQENMRSGPESMRSNQSTGTGRRQGEMGSTGRSRTATFEGESHLEKFFLDQLKDIYYAENKILQSLPKMAEATTTGELREAFEDHLHQTQRHVKRLEKVFETINQKAEGKKCEAIEGISREVEGIINETEDGTMTRDAALIIAAQKVEHYEIATYGGLVQLAITMQLHDAADLLDKTLVEEEDTDARLTEIAENEINLGAEHEGAAGSGEQEEEEEES
jgi:ferritin-like metal-binding protein YciE